MVYYAFENRRLWPPYYSAWNDIENELTN